MKSTGVRIHGFRNARLRGKLLSLMLFFVLLAAGSGGAGLVFLAGIARSVGVVADVSSPLVREASGLLTAVDAAYIRLQRCPGLLLTEASG